MKAAFPDARIDLVPSKGGAFEVILDGRTVYSKLATKRFPAYQEIPELLGA